MYFPEIRPLVTDRLLLRRLSLDDAEIFYTRLSGSETVTKYMLWQPHRDITDAVASIEKALRRYDEGRFYRWGIVLKDTGSLIGIIDLLHFSEEESSCSFAYMLGEAYWGMGYGTEAVKAVFRFAFEEMKIATITADHFAENPASGAVMRKAGMTYIAAIPGKYEKNGVRHDALLYRITKTEWDKKCTYPTG